MTYLIPSRPFNDDQQRNGHFTDLIKTKTNAKEIFWRVTIARYNTTIPTTL